MIGFEQITLAAVVGIGFAWLLEWNRQRRQKHIERIVDEIIRDLKEPQP